MKRLLLIILTLVIVFLASQCNGVIIFVDDDAPDCGDGKSWQTAYKYLQDALSAAQSGCQILVAAGTYKPDCNCANPNGTGDRNAAFQLVNGITIEGGYAGFGEADPNARNIELYKTVLSGDLSGDDGPDFANNTENSYHVVTTNAASPVVTLDGFTITGGNANGSQSNRYGGGMYNDKSRPTVTDCKFTGNSAERGAGIYNSYSNSTLNDCTFIKNKAAGEGGAVHNYASTSTLANCAFTENSAVRWGGGMYNSSSSPGVTNCTFSDNSAGQDGGGVYNLGGSPKLTDCAFIENSAVESGGGMYNYTGSRPNIINCAFSGNSAKTGGGIYNLGSSPTLTDCTFVENRAARLGGGMENYSSSPIVTNCTFTKNLAEQGGVIFNIYSSPTLTNCTIADNNAASGPVMACDSYQQSDPSAVKIVNCIVWNGFHWLWNNDVSMVTIICSDVEGGWLGEGNIDKDPCFIDSDGRLSSNSPCIDAGDSNALPFGIWTDLDGEPRFVDDPNTADSGVGTPPIVDMGAYEFQDDVFKGMECFPQTYSTYGSWIALGKPNCWCGMYGNPRWPYQCDGDVDNKSQVADWRVYTDDLTILANNWKKKSGDPTFNPCADFDHKGQVAGYRVYTNDLTVLSNNWKKTSSQLPDHCPRPE